MSLFPHQIGDPQGRLGAGRVAQHDRPATSCQATYCLACDGSAERVDGDVDTAGR
jgi:hypothetical protein